MERTKTAQAIRTMIQNKAMARTHKTRQTMTVTATTMMIEMKLEKQKRWIMTLTSMNKLRQSKEWARKSKEWTAQREKIKEWVMVRELQEWMISTITGVDDKATSGVDTPRVDDDVPGTKTSQTRPILSQRRNELTQTTKKIIQPRERLQRLQHHR